MSFSVDSELTGKTDRASSGTADLPDAGPERFLPGDVDRGRAPSLLSRTKSHDFSRSAACLALPSTGPRPRRRGTSERAGSESSSCWSCIMSLRVNRRPEPRTSSIRANRNGSVHWKPDGERIAAAGGCPGWPWRTSPRRVGQVRQVEGRQEAVPLVPAVAGHRQQPVPVRGAAAPGPPPASRCGRRRRPRPGFPTESGNGGTPPGTPASSRPGRSEDSPGRVRPPPRARRPGARRPGDDHGPREMTGPCRVNFSSAMTAGWPFTGTVSRTILHRLPVAAGTGSGTGRRGRSRRRRGLPGRWGRW